MLPTTDQLFLLLTKDDGKLEGIGTQRGYGLIGAMVSDLLRAGRITLTEDKKSQVRVLDPRPTGDPVLDHGLQRIVAKFDGKAMSSLISDSKLNPEQIVVNRLCAAGILETVPKRALGLVQARYPVLNPAPEQDTRNRLAAVLRGSIPPGPVDSTILAILQGLGVAHNVLEQEAGGLSKQDLKRRIEQVAAADPAGDAVQKAVAALNVALMTAVVIPVVINAGS